MLTVEHDDQTKRSTIRHPRYARSATTNNLKCHGVFSSSVAAFVTETGRPQLGQFPSDVIAVGAKYLAQSSHHGISALLFPDPQLDRC